MLLHFLVLGNKQGDVYYVESESAGYVWIDDNGTLRWELLGMTVDTSNFLTKTGLLQSSGTSTNNTMSQNAITQELANKQPNLVSGTNIKTINNESILGSGNIEIQGGGTSLNISTTEKVIGTYFGKPLYEKTLNFGTLTQTGSTISLAHNVANVAIPVWARGYFRGTNDNYPLPFGNHDTSINRITTGSIQMNNTQNWSGWTLYVDFYYTKTTD